MSTTGVYVLDIFLLCSIICSLMLLLKVFILANDPLMPPLPIRLEDRSFFLLDSRSSYLIFSIHKLQVYTCTNIMSTLLKLLADTHTRKNAASFQKKKGEKNPERMRHSPSMNVSPTKLNNPNKAQNDVFSCVWTRWLGQIAIIPVAEFCSAVPLFSVRPPLF